MIRRSCCRTYMRNKHTYPSIQRCQFFLPHYILQVKITEMKQEKTLTDLPAELLQLIFDHIRIGLDAELQVPLICFTDLWSLYNASQQLRVRVIRLLFQETYIGFQNDRPSRLNGKLLPARTILDILLRWISYIRDIYIMNYTHTGAFCLFDLLGRIPQLKFCLYSNLLLHLLDVARITLILTFQELKGA